MDWASFITDVLIVAIAALVGWAWKVYIQPWLIDHHLTEAAEIAVRAVEAIYGRYNGEEKLQAALKRLEDSGFDIDAQGVLDAVKAAWQKLNSEMIANGEKAITEITIASADETEIEQDDDF